MSQVPDFLTNQTQQTNSQSTNSSTLSISPAKFDIFLKLLVDICDSNDAVIIRDSKVIRKLNNGAIIRTDLTKIFDRSDVNLHIINPLKYIRLFKQFKNNNDIIISLDEANSRYLISNNEIRLFLPKIDESIEQEYEMPEITNVQEIDKVEIDAVTRTLILNLAKDANHIELMVKDNKVKGIHIPETAIYIFQQYMEEPNITTLDETTADLCLRSSAFLPINAAEQSIVHVCQKQDTKEFFLYTIAKLGILDVEIYEDVVDSTQGLLF